MKRIIALLLAVVLCLSMLSACGNNEEIVETSSGTETQQSEQNVEADTQEEAAEEEDTAEIVVAFYTNFPHSAGGTERVQNAINEITIPEINTSVKLMPLSMGEYIQQMSLMISANETLDLMPTFFAGPVTFNAMTSQNQLIALDELLEEYGQGIKSVIREEYLQTTKIDGVTYAVPAAKDAVSNLYLAMRTDVLEELGLVEQAENITSMQDIEAIYEVVCANTDLCGIANSGIAGVLAYLTIMCTGEFEDAKTYEKLMLDYIVSFSDDPTKVVCLYETEIFEEICQLTQRWYDAGYIYKDAANTEENNVDLVRNNKAFSMIYAAEHATYEAGLAGAEYDMTIVKIGSEMVSTSSINTIDWVIPVTSKEPEAAMKFLNMMYTNKEIVDMMNYGVKDVDYIVHEDGTYGFPEGINSGTAEFYDNLSWLFGNQFLSGVWEDCAPDTREVSAQINENPPLSKIIGFTVNTVGMENEVAALTSVQNEYFRGLSCGVLDVDTALPEFREKLKAAGIDEVVANVQAQLDAWIAENGIEE